MSFPVHGCLFGEGEVREGKVELCCYDNRVRKKYRGIIGPVFGKETDDRGRLAREIINHSSLAAGFWSGSEILSASIASRNHLVAWKSVRLVFLLSVSLQLLIDNNTV